MSSGAPSWRTRRTGDGVEGDQARAVRELASGGVATSTQARSLAVVRGVLGHAVADRSLRTNVAAAVKAPKGGRRRAGRHLSLEQLHQLAAAVPPNCGPVILVLGLCGLRFSEMAALTVADVLPTPRGLALRVHRAAPQRAGSGAAVMGGTKSHRARLIPLPAGALHDYCASRVANGQPADWLFSTSHGLIWTNTNFHARSHYTSVTAQLGIGNRNIHDLRHTAATSLLYAGADLKAVQAILGHASATMTADLYAHVVDQAPWEAMAALNELQARDSACNPRATDLPG